MMLTRLCTFAALLLLGGGAFAFEWENLTPENRLGGRMVSPGYLRGKIVVLDCRDYGSKESVEAIKALQTLWSTYKTKPFVVVGSHTGKASAKRVAALMEKFDITYPVYANASLSGAPKGASPVRVIDSTGTRVMYSGGDPRAASGVVGTAIFATRMPSGAKQWRYLLDWEIANLPGQAYLRLKAYRADREARAEMKRSFPEDAARYEEAFAKFSKSKEIKRLSKLVELSRLVKDRDTASSAGKRVTKASIEKMIAKNESLKKSENPAVVQEAKNAIADLQFAAATID